MSSYFFNKAIANNPDKASFYFNKAHCLFEIEKHKESLIAIKKYKKNPKKAKKNPSKLNQTYLSLFKKKIKVLLVHQQMN